MLVRVRTGRSLDWAVSDEPHIWFMPRGIRRTGHGDATSHEWTSRHSSLVTSIWDLGTDDGINEKGLAAHVLYLNPVEGMYEAPDERPSVMNAMWVQYVLDNFATVADVVEHVDEVRISSPELRGQHMGAHLAVEDASGDSAIIEPIEGRKLLRAGVPAELHVFEAMPHGSFGGNAPEDLELRAEVRRFERERLASV